VVSFLKKNTLCNLFIFSLIVFHVFTTTVAYIQHNHAVCCHARLTLLNYQPTIRKLSNGSPYAIGPLSVLSATLVYYGQTAGRIKMPLGAEVGLGPGHIVLDGNTTAVPRKGPSLSAYVYCGETVAHLSNCWGTLVSYAVGQFYGKKGIGLVTMSHYDIAYIL